MKKLSFKTTFIAIVSIAFLLTSCNTSLEVVKRKHRKGYHVSISNSQNQKGHLFEPSRNYLEAKNLVKLDNIDSSAIEKLDLDELLPLNHQSSIAAIDSPNIDTTHQIILAPSKSKLTLGQKINTVKRIKKKMQQLKNQNGLQAASNDDWEIDSDVMFVVMIVLAIILPPLAVYLIKGKSNAFILNLLLWLVGIGVGFVLLGGLVWWAGLLALIHAILVVLGHS